VQDRAALNAAGIARLSVSAGLPVGEAVRAANAARLAAASGADERVLYALLASSEAASPARVCLTPSRVLEKHVDASRQAIDVPDQAQVRRSIRRVKEWSARALQRDGARQPTELDRLLKRLGIRDKKKKQVINALLESESADEFARALSRGGLSNGEVARLLAGLALYCSMSRQEDVFARVWPDANRRGAEFAHEILYHYAAEDQAYWEGKIGAARVPASIARGSNAAAKYAAKIRENLHRLVPDAPIAELLRTNRGVRHGKAIASAIDASYRTKSPLSFARTSLRRRRSFAGLSGEALEEFRRLCRLSRVLPEGEEARGMEALLAVRSSAAGKRGRNAARSRIDGARDIVKLGRERFVEAYAKEYRALAGRTVKEARKKAEHVYARAAGRVRTVDAIRRTVQGSPSGLNRELESSLSSTTRLLESRVRQLGISEMLESKSYCRCEKCSSLFSPAAYLADQLYMLETFAPDAATLLRARRPDLWKLKLSCNNTNVAFPEIDAAIEALADVLQSGSGSMVERNTNIADADTLRAFSEYGDDATVTPAFGVPESPPTASSTGLWARVYPFGLPFSRWQKIADAYLGLGRTSLLELLDTSKPDSGPGDERWARAQLGLNTWDYAVLAGTSGKQLSDLWGADPTDGGWRDELEDLAEFLRRAGLEYDGLLQLKDTEFLKPHEVALKRWASDGTEADECDLEGSIILQYVTTTEVDAALEAVQSFMRLRLRLGWSVAGLDRLLRALGASAVDGGVIRAAAHLSWLAKRLGMPVTEALVFAIGVDDRAYRGEDDSPLNLAKRAVKQSSGEEGALALAAGLPAAALRALSSAGRLPAMDLSPEAVNSARRYALLLDKLKLDVHSLLALFSLAELSPLEEADAGSRLEQLVLLVRRADLLALPGLPPLELQRLLRDDAGAAGRASDAVVDAFLDELKPVLTAATSTGDSDSAGAPTGDVASALLAEFVGITADVTRELMDGITGLWSDTATSPLTLRAALALDSDLAVRRNALRGFTRVAGLFIALTTNPANQKFLLQYASQFGAFSLTDAALPQTGTAIGYDALRRFVELCQVLEASEGDSAARREALTAIATDGALDQALAERLAVGLAMEPVAAEFLIGLSGAGFGETPFTDASDLRARSGAWLLLCTGRYLRRLRIAPQTAWSWVADADIDSNVAQSIRGALAGQRTDADWRRRILEVEDRIRLATRDALVGAVKHQLRLDGDLALDSEETLSDYLLLNVESTPNVLTSRVRLAMTAVQVFIDRWFGDWYDLEPPADSIRKRWDWARNYRIFEANRKVLFFPESWATPTNRRPVSGAFGRFAALLDQGDLSEETIERGLTTYLSELVEMARPEVVALRSTWSGERIGQRYEVTPTLHLFARTRAKPYRYFYRRWERCTVWTPWEPIELDIEGDHVVPALDTRGRLFLFWATFQNRSDPDDALEITDQQPRAPSRLFDVRMLCSQLRAGRWSRPMLSSDPMPFVPPPSRWDPWLERWVWWTDEEDSFPTLNLPSDAQLQRRLRFLNRASDGRLYVFAGMGGFARDVASGTLRPVHGAFLMPTLYVPAFAVPRAQVYRETGKLRLPYETADWVDVLGAPPTGEYLIVPGHSDGFLPLRKVAVQDDARTFLISQEAGAEIDEETVVEWAPPQKGSKGSIRSLEDMAEKLLRTDASNREALLKEALDRLCRMVRIKVVGRTAEGGFSVLSLYHPYATLFLERVDRFGVAGLYRPTDPEGIELGLRYQEIGEDYFEDEYKPESVKEPYPRDEVEFSAKTALGFYNTELFLHNPLLVGQKLSDAGEYERAHKWFRFVFDPTDRSTGDPAKDVWQIKLFRDEDRLETARDFVALLGGTSDGEDDEDAEERRNNAREQLQAWLDHPFDPHAVAALRPSAYMRLAARLYIENLVLWADSLFRMATPDELPIARQRYTEALWLLGSTPVELEPPQQNPPAEGPTYEELIRGELTSGEDAIDDATPSIYVIADGIEDEPLPSFFPSQLCVPRNDKLDELREWVKLALRRLNSGLDINGEVLPTDLFGPELDPGQIIAAMQAGLSPLAALGVPVRPIYQKLRFRTLVQKALEACQEAKQAGDAVLAAAEKSDGEQLSQQRQQDQLQLLSLGIPVLGRQLDEARINLESQKRRKATVKARLDHYARIKPRLPKEKTQQKKMEESHKHQLAGQGVRAVGGALVLIGDFDIGASGWAASPVAKWRFGGLNIAKASELAGEVFSVLSSAASNESAQAALEAQWQRRDEEWRLQRILAEKELAESEAQLQAAEVRVQLAEMQLENEKARFEREKAIFDLMRDKFSSKELYDWTLQKLMPIHRALFDRARGLADAARNAYETELGEKPPASTVFGHNMWDPARRGLLSADEVRKRLQELNDAYTDALLRRDNLEPEQVSLRDIAPAAVQDLRLFGKTEFTLPEYFFDRNPYLYRRIIRSVAVTLPNVVGPYDNVNAVISLVTSKIRIDGQAADVGDYKNTAPGDTNRMVTRAAGEISLRHLITTTGTEDRGGYSSRPEGDGYLPFEGAGLVDSQWNITMRQEDQNFDVANLSDVILTFGYSAQIRPTDQRDTMADIVRQARRESLKTTILQRLLILPQDQSEAFQRWQTGGDPLGLRLYIRENLVPLGIRKLGLTPQIEAIEFLVTTTGAPVPSGAQVMVTTLDGATTLASAAFTRLDDSELPRPDVGRSDPIVPSTASPLSSFGQFRVVLSTLTHAEVSEVTALISIALR
jgi:hypothetical protein